MSPFPAQNFKKIQHWRAPWICHVTNGSHNHPKFAPPYYGDDVDKFRPERFMGSFDLFRAPASKDAAIAYQDRYRTEVVEPYMANDPKIMQTWASREGELDLDDPEIWTQYYNKPEDYHALREIKRKLDPDDLFHSKFTLRPAEH